MNTVFILLLQYPGFSPQCQYCLFRFSIGRSRQKRTGQEDSIIMGRKFMPVEAVNLLHQPFSPVPGKGMTNLLCRHKTDADLAFPGFHQVQESRPVAEALSLAINSSIIPVLSYTGRAGKTEIRPFLFLQIRHLIPFCPLLFFFSEQCGLLLSSYERGIRGSVFSSDCWAGMSFLPCITPPYMLAVPFFAHHNRIIISKYARPVNEISLTK